MRRGRRLRSGLPVATLLSLWLLAATACVFSIGDSSCPGPSAHMNVTNPVAHGPHCADIELARSISMSQARSEALARIAALPDLTEHEQLFLVDTVTVSDGFSSDKAEVLVVLAKNPALTQAARERMARQVPQADLFSGDVERISQALLP